MGLLYLSKIPPDEIHGGEKNYQRYINFEKKMEYCDLYDSSYDSNET